MMAKIFNIIRLLYIPISFRENFIFSVYLEMNSPQRQEWEFYLLQLYHSLYTYLNGGFLVNFGCLGTLLRLLSVSSCPVILVLAWLSGFDLACVVCFLLVSGLISSVPCSLLTSLLTSLWFVTYCWGSMPLAWGRVRFRLSYFISEEDTLILLMSFGKACNDSPEATSVMKISGTTNSCSCLFRDDEVWLRWTSFS